MLLKKILLYLRIGNHVFDSQVWKNNPDKRKLFIKYLMQNNITIGLNRNEITDLLGSEKVEYSNGNWAFKISSYNKRKTTDGNTKHSLILQFDKFGQVSEAKLIKWQKRK